MATTKTLKPTNVTISIPEFTDQPDQRVNSNCIDKSADAINTLSDQIGTLSSTKAFSSYYYNYNASGNRTEAVALADATYLVIIQCYYGDEKSGMYIVLKSGSSCLITTVKAADGVTVSKNGSTGINIAITNTYTGVDVVRFGNVNTL